MQPLQVVFVQVGSSAEELDFLHGGSGLPRVDMSRRKQQKLPVPLKLGLEPTLHCFPCILQFNMSVSQPTFETRPVRGGRCDSLGGIVGEQLPHYYCFYLFFCHLHLQVSQLTIDFFLSCSPHSVLILSLLCFASQSGV